MILFDTNILVAAARTADVNHHIASAWLHYQEKGGSFRRDLSEAMQLPRTVEGLHGGTWYAVLRRGDYREGLKKYASLKVRLGSGKVISGQVNLGFWDYPTDLMVRGMERIAELPRA